MDKLDKNKADIISKVEKVIVEDLSWSFEHTDRIRIQARVLAPSIKEVLELRGFNSRTRRSFTLLYQNLPIRRYDLKGPHRNPNGIVVQGPHKHTWDEIYHDGDAYIPNDIDPRADINIQFMQFLEEQNISLHCTYQYVMV